MLRIPREPDCIPTTLGSVVRHQKASKLVSRRPNRTDEGLSSGVHRGPDGKLYTNIPLPPLANKSSSPVLAVSLAAPLIDDGHFWIRSEDEIPAVGQHIFAVGPVGHRWNASNASKIIKNSNPTWDAGWWWRYPTREELMDSLFELGQQMNKP